MRVASSRARWRYESAEEQEIRKAGLLFHFVCLILGWNAAHLQHYGEVLPILHEVVRSTKIFIYRWSTNSFSSSSPFLRTYWNVTHNLTANSLPTNDMIIDKQLIVHLTEEWENLCCRWSYANRLLMDKSDKTRFKQHENFAYDKKVLFFLLPVRSIDIDWVYSECAVEFFTHWLQKEKKGAVFHFYVGDSSISYISNIPKWDTVQGFYGAIYLCEYSMTWRECE